MNEIYTFIKEAGVFYLATCNQGIPDVRPFGKVLLFDGKLYFNTGKGKAVYWQLLKNNNVALSVFYKGKTLRVIGTVMQEENPKIKNAMLESQKGVAKMYEGKMDTLVIFELVVTNAYFDTFNKRVKIV